MAKVVNQVLVTGNVTRDPELKLAGSTSLLSFGIAVNHSKKVGDEWVDEPNFFDVVTFGDLAENASESINKGDRVIISGRLSYRAWETQDGDKRSKVEILANNIAHDLSYATTTVVRNERKDG